MSLRDINQRPIGTVSAVLPNSFVARLNGTDRELRRESLFSVGQFGATLICECAALENYIIR